MRDCIVTFKSPKDPISEAFRNMRTNITFSDIDNEIKVLTITSAGKGEGKSTIMANYAVALAQSNKRILIVDCDLRQPRIHRLFERNNRVGLANVLVREVDIANAIQRTEVEGLHMMASGPIPPNPSEMLASRRMEELISLLRESYDYVLIDTPPVGVVTDAAVLSKVTDGFVIVAALDVVNKEGIKVAISNIETVGGHIIGVIANNTPMNKRSGYYYYYSAYEEDKPKDRAEKKAQKKMSKKNR